LDNSRLTERSEYEYDEHKTVKKTLNTHKAIIQAF